MKEHTSLVQFSQLSVSVNQTCDVLVLLPCLPKIHCSHCLDQHHDVDHARLNFVSQLPKSDVLAQYAFHIFFSMIQIIFSSF